MSLVSSVIMAVIIELLLTKSSAGALIFASVISMLNAELLAQGKDALRFLNTWPYENAGMSSDITILQ
jgi:hypothetical protein